ncbi:MAG TPA: chromosomal replication initiator protein DnaA [Stellaceae bacterium]|nr:chromosomal replication initiator protein DnaA [Stellaceae bacterium]
MTDGARTDDLQAQWARVRGRLKEEYGDTTYRSWLKAMTLFGIEDGKVRIGVPTRFLREWVSRHYADRIRALWNGENDSITAVEILVTGKTMAQPAETEPAAAGAAAHSGREADSGAADEKDVGAPLDPRFTFENFVVGKPNELAHAAARRVAEAQVGVNRAVPFNPLFLYGGVGLGKTHLMHAIAWHIRTNDPSRKVIYLSAEKFMYQFIRAIRFRDTMAFKDQFRSVDVLMVDDLQFIGGRDATQEEFFHTFNALVDHNRQIIISADKSPSDLEGIEERVKSRLAWGLVADVHPTNYELRLSILQNKADASRFKIAVKVLEFLAHKITSNVRELEGALNLLDAHARLSGREITIEQAEEALRAILRANERKVSIDEIQQRVAAHYNIRLADMHSARRARVVARPRQVAMYLCKQLTPRSLPEIGRKFGGRDHTTVMHAVRKIEQLKAADRTMAEDIELLRRMLEN